MCLGFPLGLLGFDLGSQSWIPWLPWLPSEFHLGFHLEFHLGFLGFQLSSIWDSILDSLASIWAPSGIPSLPSLPSELHLGFHLGSLGFDLGTPTRWQRQGLSQHL